MGTKRTAAQIGKRDARVFLAETDAEKWADAIRAGTEEADAGLINGLGYEKTGTLFGVRALWHNNPTRALCAACAEYNRAWRETVKRAIMDAGSADLTDPRD